MSNPFQQGGGAFGGNFGGTTFGGTTFGGGGGNNNKKNFNKNKKKQQQQKKKKNKNSPPPFSGKKKYNKTIFGGGPSVFGGGGGDNGGSDGGGGFQSSVFGNKKKNNKSKNFKNTKNNNNNNDNKTFGGGGGSTTAFGGGSSKNTFGGDSNTSFDNNSGGIFGNKKKKKTSKKFNVKDNNKGSTLNPFAATFTPSSSMAMETDGGAAAFPAAKNWSKTKVCRYDPNCTRADCTFAHPKRDAGGGSGKKTKKKNAQICRYDPNCTRPDCKFLHPSRDGGADNDNNNKKNKKTKDSKQENHANPFNNDDDFSMQNLREGDYVDDFDDGGDDGEDGYDDEDGEEEEDDDGEEYSDDEDDGGEEYSDEEDGEEEDGEDEEEEEEEEEDDAEEEDDDDEEEEGKRSTVDRTGVPDWLPDSEVALYRRTISKPPSFSGKKKSPPSSSSTQFKSKSKPFKKTKGTNNDMSSKSFPSLSSSNKNENNNNGGGFKKNKIPKKSFPKQIANKSLLKSTNTNKRRLENPTIETNINSAIIGICTEMCPFKERQLRVEQNDVPLLEQEHPSRPGWTDEMMMVKAFKRSSQATELNVPKLCRTPKTLWESWNYMKNNILDIDLDGADQRFIDSDLIPGKQDRANLKNIHEYMWDRTKMIAKDFSMQGITLGNSHPMATAFFEECARYHIWVEYEKEKSHNLNSRNLNERLKTLNEFYDRDYEKGKVNLNEAEFRAYYILQHVGNTDKAEIPGYLRDLSTRPEILNAPIMQEALKIWVAWKRNDYQRFFSILKASIHVLVCCQAFQYVGYMRYTALQTIHRVNKGPKQGLYFPLHDLVGLLGFDNVQVAEEVCIEFGLTVAKTNAGAPCVILKKDNRPVQPDAIKKRRNETLVDSKRGAKGGRTRISVIEEDEPNRTFKALPTAASIAPTNSITSTTTTSDTTIPDISTTTANNKAEMIRREKALQLKEAIRLKKEAISKKIELQQQRLKEKELARQLEKEKIRKQAEAKAEEKRLREAERRRQMELVAAEAERQQKIQKQLLQKQQETLRKQQERQKLLQEQKANQLAAEQQREKRIALEAKLTKEYKDIISDFKEKYTQTKVVEQKMKYQLNKTNMTILNGYNISNDIDVYNDAIQNLNNLKSSYGVLLKMLQTAVSITKNQATIMLENNLGQQVSEFRSTYDTIYISKINSDGENILHKAEKMLDTLKLKVVEIKRNKAEIRLTKLYFRFHKWKCIARAKYDPRALEMREKRFSFAISKEVIPMSPLFGGNNSHQKKRRAKSREHENILNNSKYWSELDVWNLFPKDSMLKGTGSNNNNTHRWKLVLIVDDLLKMMATYRPKMAWIQRWVVRKLSKGNVDKYDSSVSRILSSYKVSISTDDAKNKSLEDDFDNSIHNNFDEHFLRVCIRSVCVSDKKISDSDMKNTFAGAHSLLFLVLLENNQLSDHDKMRLETMLKSIRDNANLSLLIVFVSPNLKSTDEEKLNTFISHIKQQVEAVVLQSNKIKDVKVLPIENEILSPMENNNKHKRYKWDTGAAVSVVEHLSENYLINGIRWLLKMRPVCPKLKKSLLKDVVEEWASFLPLTNESFKPIEMIRNFNVLLATTAYLLTQSTFQKLPTSEIAPEFINNNLKSYEDNGDDSNRSNDKNDWNLNWNSKARFQRIKQLLHASMLQKFPANERQNDSEITRSLPFFESYRNTFIKYVSDLGHGRDVLLRLHELFNFARTYTNNDIVTIPWRSIMDVIINAQIGRLNEYVVFPSDVDNYNFICQAMCQVRSTMASSHDMNVENVPLKCVLRVEQLLLAGVSNNTNISDNNNPVQRKKSFRKRRRENDENYLEDDVPLERAFKRSRFQEIDQLFTNEKEKSNAFEAELMNMLKDGERF